MQEALKARNAAQELEDKALAAEDAGDLHAAQHHRHAAKELRGFVDDTRRAADVLRQQALHAHRAGGASETQASDAQAHLALLEAALAGGQAATVAAERSEELMQQAADASQAAADAKEQAAQLQERWRYALREAQETEAKAEQLANDGDMEESMAATAAAARCGRNCSLTP